MTEISGKNFGLVIAFLLPGFAALCGVGQFSPYVAGWISSSQQGAPTVGGFLYVTLGSLAAGLTVSAIRWAIVDAIHHRTGIQPPKFDFANLNEKLPGFHGLIENHYRHYQFYSNMFIAAAFTTIAYFIKSGPVSLKGMQVAFAVLALESVLFAGSRDALRKYYQRAERLLGTSPSSDPAERTNHDQRIRTRKGKGNQARRSRKKGTRTTRGRKAREGR